MGRSSPRLCQRHVNAQSMNESVSMLNWYKKQWCGGGTSHRSLHWTKRSFCFTLMTQSLCWTKRSFCSGKKMQYSIQRNDDTGSCCSRRCVEVAVLRQWHSLVTGSRHGISSGTSMQMQPEAAREIYNWLSVHASTKRRALSVHGRTARRPISGPGYGPQAGVSGRDGNETHYNGRRWPHQLPGFPLLKVLLEVSGLHLRARVHSGTCNEST